MIQAPDQMEIGRRLVALRGSRSQREVANALGISESAYSQYEAGLRSPRDKIKIRIANYYGKPIQKIFF